MLSVIEALVRIGGSLLDGEHLAALCQELGRLAARHSLLVVPGGGPFADVVRFQDRRFSLGKTATHWMAILAIDQYGYLLSELIPTACPVRDLDGARQALAAGHVPVLLPFEWLYKADPLPHSWQVTSDSIAAWLAHEAQIPRLVLLKDVDGLYDSDPSVDPQGELLATITLDELARCEGVDANLPSLLAGSDLELWVLNGNEPGRLAELLAGGQPRGTRYHGARI